MGSPGIGERGAILSGGDPGIHRPRVHHGPRSAVDPAELAAVEGLTMREAERRLRCTAGGLRAAMRVDRRGVEGGRVGVRHAG